MSGTIRNDKNNNYERTPEDFGSVRSTDAILKDDDVVSLGRGTRYPVVILQSADGLTINQLGPGIDRLDFELQAGSYSPISIRTPSRSRKNSGERSKRDSEEMDLEEAKRDREEQESSVSSNDSLFSKRMTIAGGFLDIALFTSNCEQLKSVLEIKDFHKYFDTVVGLLITSMVLQALCFMTLFMLGCQTIKKPGDKLRGEILNHITMGLIALITVVNIFIASFNTSGDVMKDCNTCLDLKKRNMPLC